MSDKENAVQQARIWAQEARALRSIVQELCDYFGVPAHDWEAVSLIKAAHEAKVQAAADTGLRSSEQPPMATDGEQG